MNENTASIEKFQRQRKRKKVIVLASIAIIALAAFAIFFLNENKQNTETSIFYKDSTIKPPRIEYGVNIDSLIIYKDTIKPNELLSNILLRYNVDYQTIDAIANGCRTVFDVRKMRAGNKFAVITDLFPNDTIEKALYFIYELSPIEYIKYDLRDSVIATIEKKETVTEIRKTSGIITSSLWKAMKESNTDPELAISLSEIYAWTIDFYGLQKNDMFKVIFEEISIEGEYVGIGKVKAAWFKHGDKELYAFRYLQDSIEDYFDESGNSLRREFLKAPLRFSRISSRFSHSRMHPILKYRRPHHGVDYAAPQGTPVRTIGDGLVTEASYKGGGGNTIKIKHNGTYTTVYMHLWKFADGIKPGTRVTQGQVIGYVGSTGLSTGPHLDFRFYKNGSPVDPLKIESPPTKPIDSVNMKPYIRVKDSLIKILDKINVAIPESSSDSL